MTCNFRFFEYNTFYLIILFGIVNFLFWIIFLVFFQFSRKGEYLVTTHLTSYANHLSGIINIAAIGISNIKYYESQRIRIPLTGVPKLFSGNLHSDLTQNFLPCFLQF